MSLKYLTTYSADQPNWPKDLGYIFKKNSLGVRSPSICAKIFIAHKMRQYLCWPLMHLRVFISWLHLPQWSRYVWAMMPIEKISTKNVKLTSLLACPFFISFCDVMVSQRELNSLVLSGLAHLLHTRKSGVQFPVQAFFFLYIFWKKANFPRLVKPFG